jgi:hypothetical protein
VSCGCLPLALPPDILRCVPEDSSTPAGQGLGEGSWSLTRLAAQLLVLGAGCLPRAEEHRRLGR